MEGMVVKSTGSWYTVRLSNGNYCFPNKICVMDDECMKIATQEGVPKSIIHVTGSPAIENGMSFRLLLALM